MRYRLAFPLAFLFAVPAPGVADACIHGAWGPYDPTPDILEAETELEREHWRTAFELADAVDTTPMEEQAARDDLEQRRQQIIAIAHLRLGHTGVAKRLLDVLAKSQPDDATLQARHAEALAALGDRAKGRELLTELESRNSMPDAAAWVALAKLHDDAGAVDARNRAIAGCKALTKTKYKRNCAFKLTARRR
jgi:predicted Zn-dependent protease